MNILIALPLLEFGSGYKYDSMFSNLHANFILVYSIFNIDSWFEVTQIFLSHNADIAVQLIFGFFFFIEGLVRTDTIALWDKNVVYGITQKNVP
jgi:hypothetical protein